MKKPKVECIEMRLESGKGAANKVYINGTRAKRGNPLKKGQVISELEPVFLLTTKGKVTKKGKSVAASCRWVCVGGKYYYICT